MLENEMVKAISLYLKDRGIRHLAYSDFIMLIREYDIHIRFNEIVPYPKETLTFKSIDKYYNLSLSDPELLSKIVGLYVN